jgi:hypothetical protein
MRASLVISYLLILIAASCVDRFNYEIEKTINNGISVSGFISDQPGPYEVRVYSLFDIESKESTKIPISVKAIELSDNLGITEKLTEVNAGVYQTSASGIRGEIGMSYRLRVELFDGRIYESVPDTISPSGSLDSVYYNFKEQYNDLSAKQYSLDVFFDTSYNSEINNHFIWRFTGTFQADTQPENYNGQACFYLDEISKCNFLPPCSGYRNVGTNKDPIFEKKFPCTCCVCWYNLYNEEVIISDDFFTGNGLVKGAKARNVPLNQWTLEYKIRIDMSQLSLTDNSFRFWKAIKDQKEAIGSLFQPVVGKIPSNFVQITGKEIPIEGLFYATSIRNKVLYIKHTDLPPDLVYQISFDKPLFGDDCRNLFPHSSNLKPAFWED